MEPMDGDPVQQCAICCGHPSIPTLEPSRGRHHKNKHSSSDAASKELMGIRAHHGAVFAQTPKDNRAIRGRPSKSPRLDMRRTLPILLRTSYVAVVVMALLVAPTAVVAFNVDIESAMVHTGAEGSMFGYSVSQHIDQSTNWLLIGAPRYQTSQIDVYKGGAVFRCKTDRKNSCQEIPFDDTGNNRKYVPALDDYLFTEDKSNQWFGATIKSSGENGVIVACAPRYVYYSQTLDKREPIGVCYLAKTSKTKYEKYSPCATDQYGFHRQGYCQAGFSAALSQDGKRLLIGAPGSWYWQGQLYNYNTDDGGDIYSSTPEGGPEKDDTYMGYASAIGQLNDDAIDDYVVGIPKGAELRGKVEMFDQNMTSFGELIGEQIGSYFGSAIAVTDLSGDGLDDIIVGAPFYAEFGSDKFDTGRVYIFYQSSAREFQTNLHKKDILDGSYSRGRFGIAISGLGDLNYDGYKDLCIGAPFAGDDKNGAVYIYHGSKMGIITNPTQVVFAKDIGSPLSAFGISIAGGWDQDGNEYPDILVGAYTSDRAVFLRTRPVVKVIATLTLSPNSIDLESKSCSLADNTRVPCLTVYTCLEYSGHNVPESLYFDVDWTLDAKSNESTSQEQRAFYTTKINSFKEYKLLKLDRKTLSCTTSYAYVKNDPGDKLSPIRAVLNFKLNEGHMSRQKSQDLPPILDERIPTQTASTVQIQKDCGADNICIPDLEIVPLRLSREHEIGSTAAIEIMVKIVNAGEDSYNTKLWISLPPGVAYDSIANQRSDIPISCGTMESDYTTVLCELGNPMQKQSKSELTLYFTPTNTNDTKDVMTFTFLGNSSNQEAEGRLVNNEATLTIPVIVTPEIALFGKASPDLIVLNTTEQRGEDEGRAVEHVFQLFNQGLSATKETELQIRWPSFDVQGNPVLSIESPLKIEGNGKCNIIVIMQNASSYLGWGGSNTNVVFTESNNRGKRDTDNQRIMCSQDYCSVIQCVVGYMEPSASFVLTIPSRLKARSFIRRREATEMYHIISVAHARVRSVPYDLQRVDPSRFPVEKLELVTKVNTDRLRPASKGVEPWIIAVAVTAGLLMLLLLILLLWWCGFFKRKKPEEEGYFVVNGKSDIDNKVVD